MKDGRLPDCRRLGKMSVEELLGQKEGVNLVIARTLMYLKRERDFALSRAGR